jgi:hypothetical protein
MPRRPRPRVPRRSAQLSACFWGMIAIGLRQNLPQTPKVAQANSLCVILEAVRRAIGFDPTCRPSTAETHVHSCWSLCAYIYGCPQGLLGRVVYSNSARARIYHVKPHSSITSKIKGDLDKSSAHSQPCSHKPFPTIRHPQQLTNRSHQQ